MSATIFPSSFLGERCTTRRSGTEGKLRSKHVDVLEAVAAAKIVAEEGFNHLAVLECIPTYIPLAED